MKRYGNLWNDIISMDTLRYAHQQAKRGKGHYRSVKTVEKDVDGHLLQIKEMLENKTFTTSRYEIEDRMEGGKMRRIYKLPYFPDRIIQHALMSVVGPIFRRSLIRDTFQSLPNRGTSDARRRVQKMMKSDPQPYALKMDIRKYYPSIINEHMKSFVRKKIKCSSTLWLLDNIIDSMKGLPIGNLSSQYLGNVYLCWVDWWIKQNLGVRYYYRYCDDMILFADNKSCLRDWKKQIEISLSNIGLEIKDDWQIVDTRSQGIDFVGYVFGTDTTRIRRLIASRFKLHAKKSRSGLLSFQKALDGFIAYKGWLMRGNNKMLWRKHIRSIHNTNNSLRGTI